MFRKRLLEWVTSWIILALGLLLLFFPHSANASSLDVFYNNALPWSIACIGVGAMRMIALIINGHWNGGTPIIRMLGSIAGAMMFGAFVGSLLQTSSWYSISFGVVTYGVLMCAEMISAVYSASDIVRHNKTTGA